MGIAPDEKQERLRNIGMIIADELPAEYADVVDSLTPDEIETLVSVKKRLDLAEKASGRRLGDYAIAP